MTFCEKKEMDVIRIQARVNKKDIIYVDGLLESYENLAVVRTIDPKKGIIEFLISPSFLSETKELLTALKEEIGLEIIE